MTPLVFQRFWFIGDDESQVYSSERACLVSASDQEYLAWCSSDAIDRRKANRAANMDEVIAAMREMNQPPYHRVAKSMIISRLTDAQLEQALTVMTVRQRERWYAPDQGYINADDPESIALLQGIGADPVVVLAAAS